MDAGGLLAVERDERRVLVLLARARERHSAVLVPATALTQVIPNPARQARLARLLRQRTTTVVPLDRADATMVGRLLAESKTNDVVDAHVVVCARRHDTRVVTSDPDDIHHLDSSLTLLSV